MIEENKTDKPVIDKKANKQLSKGLNGKAKKPSWWSRTRRKKLVGELSNALKDFGVKNAYAHKHFITADERKPKSITIYVDFGQKSDDAIVNRMDMAMDSKFKKYTVNIIDVNSLQPAIKEYVFKDIDLLF